MPLNRARLIVAALFVLLLLGLISAGRPSARRLPPRGTGDAFLHLDTIDRIRSGAGYYDAVGEELRRGHYPLTHVFNWRTPAHYLAIAALSVPVAAALLKVLAFAASMLTGVALARESRPVILLGVLAQLGAVATSFSPMAAGVAEVWAGVLIALSLCAYVTQRWTGAAILGVVSLFVRELAAPYCLACALLAFRSRRRYESYVWTFGALAYAVYFGIHARQVLSHQLPGDLSQTDSWLKWNALAFTIDTVRVNGWLAIAPRWAAVLYIVLGVASTAARRAPLQVTAPLIAYCLLFAFAGRPFNYYWGFVTAPVWAFAAAYGIEALRTLSRSFHGLDSTGRVGETARGT
jgi:hypothetical protein